MNRHLVYAAAAACFACLSASTAAVHKSSDKAAVPLDRVPQAVVDAAGKAVQGIVLSEAKIRAKKSGVVFKLAGSSGDKYYALKVDAAGKVLSVERDEAPRERKAARPAGKKNVAPEPTGPIGETFPGSPAVRVGFIRHAPVRESSGIAASRTQPGVYWMHNDKGNPPMVYAISREGALLAEFHVSTTHDDWEDVAVDNDGNLYVGNIGNNNADREWLEVHRLKEPQPSNAGDGAPAPSRSLKVDRTWRLRFPGDPFDCESLFVSGAHGYVISKHADGAPAALYRFPLDGDDDVTLERVAELPTRAPVTAADLSPDGGTLAVLSYGELCTFPVAGDVSAAGRVEPVRVRTPDAKLEGVCVTPDGVVVTSEGRDVYLFPNDR
jgi:hypothetical protein